jgi:hypothetical protein
VLLIVGKMATCEGGKATAKYNSRIPRHRAT